MRISDTLVALAVLVGAALPAGSAVAQATPPQRCVVAVEPGVFSGGWAYFQVLLVTVSTRFDCPLTRDFSAGLDWAVVHHAVNDGAAFVAGNPYPHLTWSRRFGALRPSVRLGVVPPSSGSFEELAKTARARALAATGYLEPWLYAPQGGWLALQTGLVLEGAFLLEAGGSLAGYLTRYSDGLTAQLALALGARIAHRVDLGARVGLHADLLGDRLLPYSTVEVSAMPFVRVHVGVLRFDAGFLINLGPGLPSGFQPQATWSATLGVVAEL